MAQIPCGASYGPPDDCLQWSTGITGRITTFNFLNSGGSHLNNQNYNHCIRQESGYCCVQYTVSNSLLKDNDKKIFHRKFSQEKFTEKFHRLHRILFKK